MSSNLVLPDWLGDEGDCEGHDRCEDEGDGGEVEEVDVAHGRLDPLGPGVGLRRAAGGLAETDLYRTIKVKNIFGKLFFFASLPKLKDETYEADEEAKEQTVKRA